MNRRRLLTLGTALGLAAVSGSVRARAARPPFVPIPSWRIDPPKTPPTTTTTTTTLPPPPTTVHPPPAGGARVWTAEQIGSSVRGRPIVMYNNLVAGATARLLVVAAIHGDERWTSPLAHRLMEEALPHHLDVYVVPEANPDGWAADTRLNANRVDLNRNFDWRWAPYDGGPTPYSEPEARALAETVLRLQPTLAVWIHQPLGYVAGVGTTNPAYADAWRAPVDLPTRVGLDQHGGGETWTAMVAGFPSILVEMLGDEVYETQFDAHVEGYRRLLELL